MTKFPEVLIIRYYEEGTFNISYSDYGDKENLNKIYGKLDNELKNDKHLESYEVIVNGEGLEKEEI